MADREKVIKALEYCVLSDDCRSCEYWIKRDDHDCQIMKDALALLKEQDNCENCAIAIEDRQPVVRCKNCKYHYVDGDNVRYNMCLLLHNKAQPDDWFCADGERKE